MMSERRAFKQPPEEVLRAFGAGDPPVRLEGGQGQAVRSGAVVLKPAVDDERTAWIARFCLETPLDGFRLPRPVCTDDGRFVYQGWSAWEHIPGEHRKDRWPETVELCVRFHEAIAFVQRPRWMDGVRAEDPWTMADRAIWGELAFDPHPRIAPAVELLTSCLREVGVVPQLIHGDFGGNVLHSDECPPAVIDMSPYWRPAAFAVGVVVADAVVWEGADLSLIDVADGIRDFEQWLARAELRRVIELDAAHRLWGWDTLGEIDAHERLIREIARRCRAHRRATGRR